MKTYGHSPVLKDQTARLSLYPRVDSRAIALAMPSFDSISGHRPPHTNA